MHGEIEGVDPHDPTWIKGIFNVGSALRFDGNDYITIPDSPALRPARLTLSAWVRGDSSPGPYKYVVAKGADACESSSFALYTTDTGRTSRSTSRGDDGFVRSPVADGERLGWPLAPRRRHLTMAASCACSSTVARSAPEPPRTWPIRYDLPSPDMSLGSYQGECTMYLVGRS